MASLSSPILNQIADQSKCRDPSNNTSVFVRRLSHVFVRGPIQQHQRVCKGTLLSLNQLQISGQIMPVFLSFKILCCPLFFTLQLMFVYRIAETQDDGLRLHGMKSPSHTHHHNGVRASAMPPYDHFNELHYCMRLTILNKTTSNYCSNCC